MKVIAEGLKQNHTILGIHLKGNEAEVDPNGFLRCDETSPKELNSDILLKDSVFSRIGTHFEKSTGIVKSM
jgi:hypothetical protein